MERLWALQRLSHPVEQARFYIVECTLSERTLIIFEGWRAFLIAIPTGALHHHWRMLLTFGVALVIIVAGLKTCFRLSLKENIITRIKEIEQLVEFFGRKFPLPFGSATGVSVITQPERDRVAHQCIVQ